MNKSHLDVPNESYHCWEHTEELLNARLDTLELWDNWGVINDATVDILLWFGAESLIYSLF